MKVRIVQFNILNSGNLRERYPKIREALEPLNPDIVAFQEAIDQKLLIEEMNKIGFNNYVKSVLRSRHDGAPDSVMIFSPHPLVSDYQQDMTYPNSLVYGTFNVNDTLFNVFTTHSTWGFQNEGVRLKRAYHIDKKAERFEKLYPGSISVLAADMNSEPDSRSIRFLKGKDLAADNETSTLWVDAHDMAGTKENWTTTGPENTLARETALKVGIALPEYLPNRRIDYIMVRGWRYGRTGTPVGFGRVESPHGVELSDHYGIWADIAVF